MNKFEQYLINNGIRFQTASKYGRVADKFIDWLKTNNLKAGKVKRSRFTDFLQSLRNAGNIERTVLKKESVINHYYNFLGTKNNPAKSFIKRKKEYLLPPTAIEKSDLIKIYENLKPASPTDYRDRCMLGFVLYQGLLRAELQELRISDINFETGEVFVQGQIKTNARTLKLEPAQMMHLYDYLHKYRKDFLCYRKTEPDNLFLSKGTGATLNNSLSRVLKKLKQKFPQIDDLKHIRASVITNWQKQDGIKEAMYKAGHRYITSTDRYRTDKYEELQKQLMNLHPLEYLNI